MPADAADERPLRRVERIVGHRERARLAHGIGVLHLGFLFDRARHLGHALRRLRVGHAEHRDLRDLPLERDRHADPLAELARGARRSLGASALRRTMRRWPCTSVSSSLALRLAMAGTIGSAHSTLRSTRSLRTIALASVSSTGVASASSMRARARASGEREPGAGQRFEARLLRSGQLAPPGRVRMQHDAQRSHGPGMCRDRRHEEARRPRSSRAEAQESTSGKLPRKVPPGRILLGKRETCRRGTFYAASIRRHRLGMEAQATKGVTLLDERRSRSRAMSSRKGARVAIIWANTFGLAAMTWPPWR